MWQIKRKVKALPNANIPKSKSTAKCKQIYVLSKLNV
jgi:hypothetical protein